MSVENTGEPDKKPVENAPLEPGEIEALKAYSMGMLVYISAIVVHFSPRSICSIM